MKAVAFASVVALVSGALAQDFTINTPGSLTECEPVLLSWTGGKGAVYPSGSPTTNLETLTTTNSTSFTWEVNVASGQSIGFSVLDSTGEQKQTAAVPIQAGSTTDCLNQSLSGSAGPTSSSSGSGSATSTGSGTTTTGTSYVVFIAVCTTGSYSPSIVPIQAAVPHRPALLVPPPTPLPMEPPLKLLSLVLPVLLALSLVLSSLNVDNHLLRIFVVSRLPLLAIKKYHFIRLILFA
ncbi:hypothetical protein F5878DRAFT_131579 [Lentinula raphanica]|uniref:Uncharacterized protein n=1 Tax=Lentinula raphanica TaxID=153919 RepID=A0AA38UI84_9AGAR|nr:hypothetical protein F5878DRAFT_131579 [Lentinula raphanica]